MVTTNEQYGAKETKQGVLTGAANIAAGTLEGMAGGAMLLATPGFLIHGAIKKMASLPDLGDEKSSLSNSRAISAIIGLMIPLYALSYGINEGYIGQKGLQESRAPSTIEVAYDSVNGLERMRLISGAQQSDTVVYMRMGAEYMRADIFLVIDSAKAQGTISQQKSDLEQKLYKP